MFSDSWNIQPIPHIGHALSQLITFPSVINYRVIDLFGD